MWPKKPVPKYVCISVKSRDYLICPYVGISEEQSNKRVSKIRKLEFTWKILKLEKKLQETLKVPCNLVSKVTRIFMTHNFKFKTPTLKVVYKVGW